MTWPKLGLVVLAGCIGATLFALPNFWLIHVDHRTLTLWELVLDFALPLLGYFAGAIPAGIWLTR